MTDKNLDHFIKRYRKDIKKIAQVGAHFGQELEILTKNNIIEVFLFEPNKVAVEVLESKIEMLSSNSIIKLFPYALGNTTATSEMYYSDQNDGQSSSILEPDLHKVVQPGISFKNKIPVKVRRFEDLDIENIDFLIMDVQGFELEVLKGFGQKLKRLQFIYTEVNRDSLYKDNVLIEELDNYLKINGFIRIWISWRTADMPWGDAFYLRKDKLGKIRIVLNGIKNYFFTSKLYFTLFRIFDIRLIKKNVKKFLGKK